MTLYVLFPLIAAYVSLFLGLFTLLKNRKSYTNQTFALWNFSIAFWNYGISMMYGASTPESALFWVKFLVVGLVFIPPTFYHFVLAFTEDKNIARRILCFSGYVFAGFFLVFNRGTYFAIGMQRSYFGYHPIVGIASHLFNLMFGFFVIYSFYVLFSAYKQSSGLRRRQIKYVFWAAAIGFGGGLTNMLALYGIDIYPISNLCIIFFSVIIAYAILRYHLMDIEVVIKKSIVYSILVGATMGSYVLLTLLFGQFLHDLTHNSTLAIIFMMSILIITGYKPLEMFIENTTDKIFFKAKYDYHKALKDLSREICSVIDMKQLFNLIVMSVAKTVRINRVSMLTREDNVYWFGAKYEYGGTEGTLSEIKIKSDEAFNEYLIMNNELIIVDEITDEKIKDNFKRLKISICFPLIGKEGLIGMVNIGDKLSEDQYANEDLRVLSTLANQASIALENAKLIQREGEMKRKLQQAEKLASLGRFAAGMVHEIKNPLVSVKAFFQLFGDENESEEDKRELSELASQEIIRIEGLLDNLLNFAKPSSPEFSREDLYDVLIETVQLVKPEVSARKVTIITEKDREELPKIRLDRKQIKQVFLNLIYNSLDAMPEGGELRIKISLDSIGKKLIAEIKDNGCGIEEKDIDKLFDPFYSTKAEGTGLGLAISYNIIKNHNGDIDVQSEPGLGSTFKISLPVS